MTLPDQNGKIFGFFHVIDVTVFLFFLAILTTVLVYLYAPPLVHEQEEVFFQIYFVSDEYSQPFPYAMVQDTFIPGTVLSSPQGSHLTITNVTFTHVFLPSSNVNFLVTFNGTLEKGSDGQYLFDGYEITPGKMILLEINHSYFTGTTYRINFAHKTTNKIVSIDLKSPSYNLSAGDKIYDSFGQEQGVVVSVKSTGTVILNITVDIYDGTLLFRENPLYLFSPFVFKTRYGDYEGQIAKIDTGDFP